MKMFPSAVVAAAALAGCATEYVPLIDTQGVNMDRYQRDLADCRQYAATVDGTKEVIAGQVAGALAGAIVGGGTRYQRDLMGKGAEMGGYRGAAGAMKKQESILTTCLIGRGYRVLGGSYAAAAPAGQSIAVAAETTAPTLEVPQAAALPLPPAASSPSPMPRAHPVELGTPKLPEPTGQDSYVAERVSREMKCTTTQVAKLIGKGPGYESYSFACTNRETLIVRCEMGNCRALK